MEEQAKADVSSQVAFFNKEERRSEETREENVGLKGDYLNNVIIVIAQYTLKEASLVAPVQIYCRCDHFAICISSCLA